jgi:hypothetical protein
MGVGNHRFSFFNEAIFMDISDTGLVNLALAMQSARFQDQKDVAVLKLVQDQTQQNGENVMQLLNSVPQAASGGPLGAHIDVRA